MEKRPNIFKPTINKKLNNNKNTYYSFIEETIPDINNSYNNIKKSFKVNKISNNNYIFNVDVLILNENVKNINSKGEWTILINCCIFYTEPISNPK